MSAKADITDLELDEITEAKINAIRAEVLDWAIPWKINRAFRSGSHAVRKLKTLVLGKLDSKQTDERYAMYLDQAILFSASAETADAWEGLIFKKEPRYTINDEELTPQFQQAVNFITDTGMSATELLREIVDEIVQVNRIGVLVDYPLYDMANEEKSRAEQLADGDFSNCLVYKAESIINWHYSTINGRKILSTLVLQETVDTFYTAGFGIDSAAQYRVLTLEPGESDSGYIYRQRVFTEEQNEGDNAEFRLILDVFPLIDIGDGSGPQHLEKLPFWIFNRAGQESASVIKASILSGVVELNKGHFRNSADYENEIHKVSIKTPVIPGGLMEDTDLIMGEVIETRFPESKPYIMESGQTSPLAAEMENKEKRMAYLGAKVLNQSNVQVTAETARIQAASEESTLGDIANIISEDFADMLLFKFRWDFGQDITNVSVELNTDFFENEINIPDLISAFGWMQSGGGSFETYFNLLKKRNVYPKAWTMQLELDKIKETQKIIEDMGLSGTEEVFDNMPVILDDEGTPIVSTESSEELI